MNTSIEIHDEQPDPRNFHATSSCHGSMKDKPRLAGLSILLVDDMEDSLVPFTMLMELEGATVLPANNANTALQLLNEHAVDVIVSDIALPVMDGYQFIRQVRQQQKFVTLPAIAITGMARQQDVEMAIEAGFSAYISKPVSIELFVNTICKVRQSV